MCVREHLRKIDKAMSTYACVVRLPYEKPMRTTYLLALSLSTLIAAACASRSESTVQTSRTTATTTTTTAKPAKSGRVAVNGVS